MEPGLLQCHAFVTTLFRVADQFKPYSDLLARFAPNVTIKNAVDTLLEATNFPPSVLANLYYMMTNGFVFTKVSNALEDVIAIESRHDAMILIDGIVCIVNAYESEINVKQVWPAPITEIIPQKTFANYFFYVSSKYPLSTLLETLGQLKYDILAHQIRGGGNVKVNVVASLPEEYEIHVILSSHTRRINMVEMETHIRYILPPDVLALTRFPTPFRINKKLEYYYLHPVTENHFVQDNIKLIAGAGAI